LVKLLDRKQAGAVDNLAIDNRAPRDIPGFVGPLLKEIWISFRNSQYLLYRFRCEFDALGCGRPFDRLNRFGFTERADLHLRGQRVQAVECRRPGHTDFGPGPYQVTLFDYSSFEQ